MRAKLSKVKAELIKRRDLPIPDQGRWLASVVRGHFNYYAVPDNGKAIKMPGSSWNFGGGLRVIDSQTVTASGT